MPDPPDSSARCRAPGQSEDRRGLPEWPIANVQDGLGGVYCEDCDIAELVPPDDTTAGGVREYAISPDQAARLWALSAELSRRRTTMPRGAHTPSSSRPWGLPTCRRLREARPEWAAGHAQ